MSKECVNHEWIEVKQEPVTPFAALPRPMKVCRICKERQPDVIRRLQAKHLGR